MIEKILFIVIEFILCYFYLLNEHLRGKLKDIISGILGLMVIGLLIFIFIFVNWLFGIICFGLIFIFMPITKLLASSTAFKILGYRTGLKTNNKQQQLFYDLQNGNISFNDYQQKNDKERKKIKNRLSRLAEKKQIKKILKKNDLDLDDLVEYHDYLEIAGLNDLSWKILSNPNNLSQLIELREKGKSTLEINTVFREY